MSYYLPIGSVVRLKGGVKPLMIFGINQVDPEKPDMEYDYVSVPYPEGNIGVGFQYMFNQNDIEEILFRGYDTQERTDFLNALEAYKESKE